MLKNNFIRNRIAKVTTYFTFGMHYKEGQLKMLSNFINQHHQKGDKIQVRKYIELIKNPNPFLLRQSYFFQQFSKIFKNNMPYVQKNIHQFAKQRCIPNLLLMYQSLNIHRKGLFQLIAKKQIKPYFLQMKKQLKILSYVYKVIVELHSTENRQFLKFLKRLIFESIQESTSDNSKNGEMLFVFNSICSILKYNLMQKQFNKQEAQQILTTIQDKVIPRINHSTFFIEQSYTLLSSLHQNIEIRGLTIKNERLHSYFVQAEKIKLKKRYKRHSSIFLPNKQKHIQNDQNQSGSSTIDKKYFVEGQSIFEIIFCKFLDQFGYNFQQNLIIGSNQFDVIVKGKKEKKYMPFQNLIDQKLQLKKNTTPITTQQWNTFKKMKGLSRIKIDQLFEEPVILSLNGPTHYIDSDTYGINQVTRSQQMKKYYAKLKGYNRYATVNFRQWQKIHQEGTHIRQFIQNLLKNSKIDESI